MSGDAPGRKEKDFAGSLNKEWGLDILVHSRRSEGCEAIHKPKGESQYQREKTQ